MPAMLIVLNGQSQEIPDGATVADLVERQRPGGGACAVEVNRALTPRAVWKDHRLEPGDAVELVTLVGGG